MIIVATLVMVTMLPTFAAENYTINSSDYLSLEMELNGNTAICAERNAVMPVVGTTYVPTTFYEPSELKALCLAYYLMDDNSIECLQAFKHASWQLYEPEKPITMLGRAKYGDTVYVLAEELLANAETVSLDNAIVNIHFFAAEGYQTIFTFSVELPAVKEEVVPPVVIERPTEEPTTPPTEEPTEIPTEVPTEETPDTPEETIATPTPVPSTEVPTDAPTVNESTEDMPVPQTPSSSVMSAYSAPAVQTGANTVATTIAFIFVLLAMVYACLKYWRHKANNN